MCLKYMRNINRNMDVLSEDFNLAQIDLAVYTVTVSGSCMCGGFKSCPILHHCVVVFFLELCDHGLYVVLV